MASDSNTIYYQKYMQYYSTIYTLIALSGLNNKGQPHPIYTITQMHIKYSRLKSTQNITKPNFKSENI